MSIGRNNGSNHHVPRMEENTDARTRITRGSSSSMTIRDVREQMEREGEEVSDEIELLKQVINDETSCSSLEEAKEFVEENLSKYESYLKDEFENWEDARQSLRGAAGNLDALKLKKKDIEAYRRFEYFMFLDKLFMLEKKLYEAEKKIRELEGMVKQSSDQKEILAVAENFSDLYEQLYEYFNKVRNFYTLVIRMSEPLKNKKDIDAAMESSRELLNQFGSRETYFRNFGKQLTD